MQFILEYISRITGKGIFFCMLIGLIFTACSDDLVDDLPTAVREHVIEDDCSCKNRIGRYRWNGQTMYVVYSNQPACVGPTFFYDLNGRIIEMSVDDQFDFWQNNELLNMVWICGESAR